MATFTLPSPNTLKTLSPKKRQEIVSYLAHYTVQLFHPETVDLDALLKNMHSQARKNGLTRAKLKKILAE